MRTFFKPLTIAGAIIISINSFAQQFVDQAIQPYVKSFKQQCLIYGIKPDTSRLICIKFPNRMEDSIFRFEQYKPKWSSVTITNNKTKFTGIFFSPKNWYLSDETGREMIVYHEMFHACFNLPHIEKDLLMYGSEITDDNCKLYKENREHILKTLFQSIKSKK